MSENFSSESLLHCSLGKIDTFYSCAFHEVSSAGIENTKILRIYSTNNPFLSHYEDILKIKTRYGSKVLK